MSHIDRPMKVQYLSDRSLLEAIVKLASTLDRQHYSIAVNCAGEVRQLSVGAGQSPADFASEFEEIVAADVDAVDAVAFNATSQAIPSWTYTRSAAEIRISWGGQGLVAALPLLRATKELFPLVSDLAVRERFSAEERAHLAQFEQAAGRLHDVAIQALAETQKFRTQIEAEARAKEEEATRARAVLAAEMEADYARRKAKLEEDAAALEARKTSLDDRDAVHVRREIRASLREEIKARFAAPGLSADTAKKRWPVHGLAIALLISTAAVWLGGADGLLTWMRVPELAGAPGTWAMIVRRGLGGLGFAAVAWFYIRFVTEWSRQHTETEQRLRQLQLDFDRASWLVEVTREWADAKVDAPPELLEAISRGLFVPHEQARGDEHPLVGLASHLERAEKAKLKYGDNEVELTTRALKSPSSK